MNPSIAVLVPCYNEALTIKKVVTDFHHVLPNATIYVYDNNSTDNTGERAREAGAIVRREPRQGKGNVIRSMFQDIDADIYLMVDGDDTYPAEHAPQMIEKILEGYDMVIGDRLSSTYLQENTRAFHNFGNLLVRNSINHLFGSNIHDVMTGYRAMSFTFVKTYPALSHGFELETEMTIHAIDKNVKIYEMPVNFRNRPADSSSKLNTFSDGFKVLYTIARMICEYRPLPLFTTLLIILFCIGAGLVCPIFISYWRTGMVARFPTLIVASFIILAGIIDFVAGIILNLLAKQNRKLYTYHCNLLAYNRRHSQDNHQQKEKLSNDYFFLN